MEDLFFNIVFRPMPPWVVIPIVIIILIIFLWPNLRRVLDDIFTSPRFYQDQKNKLELIKLYYEIETIKTQHQFKGNFEEEISSIISQQRSVRLTALAKIIDSSLQVESKKSRKFLYGALGAAVPDMIFTIPRVFNPTAFSGVNDIFNNLWLLMSFPLFIIVTFTIAWLICGSIVSIISFGDSARIKCIIVGFLAAQIITPIVLFYSAFIFSFLPIWLSLSAFISSLSLPS